MNEQQLKKLEEELAMSKLKSENQQLIGMQQNLEDNSNAGIVREQLDLGEELDRIEHLLRGHYLKRGEDGTPRWTKATSNDLILFTEYGINVIMGYIQWYLNKNTLLSNYSEESINTKMEDLAKTFNDKIFMEYDKIFLYPTLEDCEEEIEKRIQRKINIKKFSINLLGGTADEKQIRKEVLKEMEGRIEREFEVIKQQKIKNKLKAFDSIVRTIQDSIHSTYNRAFRGEERRTLRQHTHITESRGNIGIPQDKQGFFDKWRKK